MDNHSVIISAKRTSIGSFLGNLSSFSASDLASAVIKKMLDDLKIRPNDIDEVILGNVLSSGQGQAPARQATIKSGCPNSVESLTINKM
jgi:acetyl-CoA C-acetyltransferase